MEEGPDQMFVLAIKNIVDQHALYVSYLADLTILFLDSEMHVFNKKEVI